MHFIGVLSLLVVSALVGYVVYKDQVYSHVLQRPETVTRFRAYRVNKLREDDDEDKCVNIDQQEDKCAFVTENCQISNWINYMKLRYCALENVSEGLSVTICIVVFLMIIVLLLSVLASTADVFFVPGLTLLSKEMHLSPSVAGLTLLAFGNGAPDIFSALAGVKGDDFPLVLSALVGAGVCISTFVLGLVIFSANAEIHKYTFWRNILGYSVCMAFVIGFCSTGHINIYQGISFIVLYAVYVLGSVIYLQVKKCKENKQLLADRVAQSRANRASRNTFANTDLTQGLLFADGLDDSNIHFDLTTNINGQIVNGSSSLSSSLDTYDDGDDDGVDHTYFMEGLSYPHPKWESESTLMKVLFHIQYIFEWPFSVLRWISTPSTHIRPDLWSTKKRVFGLLSPVGLSLPLILDMYDEGDWDDMSTRKTYMTIVCVCAAMTVLGTLFYFFSMLPAVHRYNIRREEARQKAESLGVDEHQSNQNEELIDRLVLQWDLDKPDVQAKPVQVKVFELYISLIALVSSVCWLSLIADEVVAILQTVGLMFDISTTILGLTVLAIGNSVPDMISNTAIAKAGHPEIALSSIFGAPLLTTLVGLGLSLTISCNDQPNYTFYFKVTDQIIVTWVAVSLAAVLHMVVFPLVNYHPPKFYGIILMLAYAAFLVASVVMEIV